LGDRTLSRAVSLIADTSGHADRSPSDVDFAVLVDPNPRTLRTAYVSLRPGGACYCEWHSPLVGGVRRARRTLEAAGFSEIASYWSWPAPRRGAPLFWVPLDAPQTLGRLMKMAPATSVRRRLLRPILYALWRLGARVGVAGPFCTIAKKPGDAEVSSRGLLDQIRTGWHGWGLGRPPKRLFWALLTPGQRSINKVIAVVFADADREPSMIVKIARVPDAGRALERELANLRALEASGRRDGTPRPLFLDDCLGSVALGETVLSGEPLWTLLDERSYRRLALAVTDWLCDLASPQSLTPPELWWDRLVEPVLSEFADSFGPVSDPDDVYHTRRVLLEVGELPLVFEHRDCSPWNVLVGQDGRIALPDWESAEPQGLPGLDLLYFLTYLAFFYDDAMKTGAFGASYRVARDPTTFTGGVNAECEARYADRVGVDSAVFPPLRLLTWLLHSRSEHEQLVVEHGREPGASALKTSLFLTLWREELRLAP